MKIIDLLDKLTKGEKVPKKIKYNNYIYEFYEEDGDYRRESTKVFYTLLYDLEYICKLNDEIEIIEEVENKEYEDIDYADNLEQGEYIDYANDYEVKFDIVKNRRLINALIRNQQKIIKQLENK